MIQHYFDVSDDILRVTYTGEVTMAEFNEFGTFLMHNTQLPRSLNILVDARNAAYDFSESEIEVVIPKMQKHVKPYLQVNMAMVHGKPVETAYSMLMGKKSRVPNLRQAVFASENAALGWLYKYSQ